MRLSNETHRAHLALMACVVLGAVIRGLGHSELSYSSYVPLSFACHVVGLLLWMRLMRQRFVRREVRRLFSCIVALLILFLFAQTVRYEFVNSFPSIRRWMWYAFYVPITFVPTLLCLSTLYIGRPQSVTIDCRRLLVLVVPLALSALVLTNDLHQQAFRFEFGLGPEAPPDTSDHYAYGPVFYVCWAWMAVMAVVGLSVARRAVRRMRAGAKVLLPVVVIVLMVVVLPCYGLLLDSMAFENLFKFPDITCVFMVAFMEAMVVAGYFAVNEGYGDIWRASSLRGGFVDAGGVLTNVAPGSPSVTVSQVEQALVHPFPLANGDDLLVAYPVVGGTAYWARDLTRVRALQERLEDLGDALAQEGSMLAAENDLAHSRERHIQRQDLYDRVVERTKPQLIALEDMLESMPADEEAFIDRMRQAAVLAAYIKRCANMTFLEADGLVDVRELALALNESAECLRALGVRVDLDLGAAAMVRAEDALHAYAGFEAALEDALPALSHAQIRLSEDGDVVTLRCELEGEGLRHVTERLGVAGGVA